MALETGLLTKQLKVQQGKQMQRERVSAVYVSRAAVVCRRPHSIRRALRRPNPSSVRCARGRAPKDVIAMPRRRHISLLYLLDAAAWGKSPIIFHGGERNTNDGYFKQPLSLCRNRDNGKDSLCASQSEKAPRLSSGYSPEECGVSILLLRSPE